MATRSDELDYLDWEPDGPCDHSDYEVDILEGRCRCGYCSHSWWRDLWTQVRAIFPRRKNPMIVSDDEIPF